MAAQARFPFHPQDALNGIPISTFQHNAPHNLYSDRVAQALQQINDRYGAALTPDIAYREIVDLTNRIKDRILANPNTPLNEIIF